MIPPEEFGATCRLAPLKRGRPPVETSRGPTTALPAAGRLVPTLKAPIMAKHRRPRARLTGRWTRHGATGVQPQPAPPTVQAWTCTACGLHWATTVVNPTLRAALSVVGLLPTPQLRTAALLAVLRTEVTQRAQAREHTMDETVCFPVTELVNIDPITSVATTVWWCRLCGDEATAASRPAAHSDAVAHLVGEHHAIVEIR